MEHERNERHELLCAYLFGELEESERARVEGMLASDPELAAERERLEATVGLVQSTLSGGEGLSEGALGELLDKAHPAPVSVTPGWGGAGMLRAAAAVAVLVGGVAAVLQVTSQGSKDDPSDPHTYAVFGDDADLQVADAGEAYANKPSEVRAVDPALSKEASEHKGVAPEGEDSSTSWKADEIPWETFVDGESAMTQEQPGTLGQEQRLSEDTDDTLLMFDTPRAKVAPSRPEERVFAGVEVRRQVEDEEEAPVSFQKALEPADSIGLSRLSQFDPNFGAGERFQQSDESSPVTDGPTDLGRLAALEEQMMRQGVPGGSASGGDDFFIGLGQPAGGGGSQPAPSSSSGPSSPGPASPGPGGPSTPGPDSPGPSTQSRSGSGLVAGKKVGGRESRSDLGLSTTTAETEQPPARESLEGLGYVSEDSSEEARVPVDRRKDLHFEGDLDDAARGLVVEDGLSLGELDLETRVTLELERMLQRCRALPRERPRDMFFRFWGDNPFELASRDPLSTFGVDVDTASYTLARRMIREGILPEKAQIRTEEFVNYFDADLPAPTEDTFGVSLELAPSPYGGRDDRWLLRVGVRAMDVDISQRDPLSLTFVVDVSGSMKENQRLELVKHALRLLVSQLDARDTIALVAFSNEARVILPATSAAQRGVIETAIHQLQPDGSTNAEAGMRLGYELASANLDQAAHNRVVFLSDGVANMGQTDQDRLAEDVAGLRDQGIYLNTIGVGMANHNDVFLEQMANKGDGICDYVADAEDVQRAIVDRFVGAFVPVARDVKIQVEFDPTQVLRYRQLGYENRAIADADFRNDSVDAGEVGAGHQVVCLYEIERVSNASESPLATARVRWLPPRRSMLRRVDGEEGSGARELEASLHGNQAVASYEGASDGFRRSAVVAQFAEVLRRSVHTLGDSYKKLQADILTQAKFTGDEDLADLATLVGQTGALILVRKERTEVERIRDDLRELHIRLHSHELGDRPLGNDLEECRRRQAQLESDLREALRRQMEGKHSRR